MTRRLVVLRHAKSAYPDGVGDHDRPLAPRGVRDAGAAGEWLRVHVGLPDRVVVSTATRAQQTWALAAEQLLRGAPSDVAQDFGSRVTVEPRVYEAWVPTLVSIVRELPDDASTVLLVGHNPGCEDLVDRLAGDRDPAAARAVAEKYPTAGIAVLELDTPWSQLTDRSARLTTFAVPRG